MVNQIAGQGKGRSLEVFVFSETVGLVDTQGRTATIFVLFYLFFLSQSCVGVNIPPSLAHSFISLSPPPSTHLSVHDSVSA